MTEEAKVEVVEAGQNTAGLVEETGVESVVNAEAMAIVKDSASPIESGLAEETIESVANAEAMAIVKDSASPIEKEALPSFFVEKESKHRVDLDVLTAKDNGRLMSVSRKGLGIDFAEFHFLRHTEIWLDFTIPTYEEMTNYRTRAGVWNRETQQVIIDKLQLRNFFLVWHLKDWNLTDKEGNKMVLESDKDGSLTDASMKKVFSAHPTILDIALSVLEKDILFTL
jgi:hypothetical protein